MLDTNSLCKTFSPPRCARADATVMQSPRAVLASLYIGPEMCNDPPEGTPRMVKAEEAKEVMEKIAAAAK